MMNEIRVISLANAGTLLIWQGKKILIDGLYHFDGKPFSNLRQETAQKLRQGLPPFDHIDYLLFTHAHPDHFSAELTADHLERFPVKGILLPPDDGTQARLRAVAAARQIPAVTAQIGGRIAAEPEPGIRIEAIHTRHLDQKYWGMPHFLLLVTLGGDSLLFTGDVDYTHETLEQIPPLRAAFVNPLFFRAIVTGRFFRGVLQPDTLCVHHIPFREDDCYHMREPVERDAAVWAVNGVELAVLEEPEQEIVLSRTIVK